MARKAKDAAAAAESGTATGGAGGGSGSGSGTSISASELKKLMRESSKAKKAAAEAQSAHGGIISAACERYKIERKALSLTRYLWDCDEQKRGSVMRQTIDQWAKLGYFTQIDAFDDLIPTLKGIVESYTPADRSKVTPIRGGDEASVAAAG